MQALHDEIRWVWVLTSKDDRGLEVATGVYRQRFGRGPVLAYVNPDTLARVKVPEGLTLEADDYLNGSLIAFSLDDRRPGDLRQLALKLEGMS